MGWRRSAQEQRGVASVELGILLVLLVTLVFGVTEFGRAIYEYNALTKAARVGARYLSQFKAGDPNAPGVARDLVLCGFTDCTGKQPVLSDLKADMIDIYDAETTPASLKFQPVTVGGPAVGVTNLVQVTIEGYTFKPVVSFVTNDIPFGPITVTMTQAIP